MIVFEFGLGIPGSSLYQGREIASTRRQIYTDHEGARRIIDLALAIPGHDVLTNEAHYCLNMLNREKYKL